MSVEKILFIFVLIISLSKSYVLRKYLKSFAESNLIRPDYTDICSRPYDIKVYTDDALKTKLKECGYDVDTEEFEFAFIAIKMHNIYRACHNAPPLMFNCKLMEMAQNFSQYLMDNDKFESPIDKYNGQRIGYYIYQDTAGFL